MFLSFPSVSARDIQDQKGSFCAFPLSTAQQFSLLQRPEIRPFAFWSIFLKFSVLCSVSAVFFSLLEHSCCVPHALVFPIFKILPWVPRLCLASASFAALHTPTREDSTFLPSHLFFYWLSWNCNLHKWNQNFMNIFVLLWAARKDLGMFHVLIPHLTDLLSVPLFLPCSVLVLSCLALPSNRYHHCSFIWCFNLAICMYCLIEYHSFCTYSLGSFFFFLECILPSILVVKSVFLMAWALFDFPCLKEYFHWVFNSKLTAALSECPRYYVSVFWLWLLLLRSWWLIWLLLL